ncbi:MAG: response regulator [Proteobacteria bacterium]|nr:response regulator [Pseudomonadota bacterium]
MLKVLIVEDDINVSRLHSRFAEKIEGFEVVGIANTLEDAKEMVQLLEPDLILLDVFFPVGTGLELLKEIREQDSQVDVILITAAREAQTFRQAIHGGAFDYIVKPVIFDRFKKAMERFRKFRQELKTDAAFDQEDIDELLEIKNDQPNTGDVPKGIDPITLEKVKETLFNSKESLNAEEVGQLIGLSRNTARRYLEYLVSIDMIRVDLEYGTIGRPEKKFSRINS